MKAWSSDGTDLLSPLLTYLVAMLLLCRTTSSQYSSDQCSWKGSGLTHEAHARDVEQVYLRCSQGSLEWLYPTGAIIVNLRPNTASPAARRLTVCIKPAVGSRGSNVYLDRASRLRLLLTEAQQALGQVHCFGIQEGALFIEAIPYRDISRKITAFQYELVSAQQGPSTGPPCQPCSDEEVLMAVCTSDFVARGSVRGAEEGAGQSSVAVTLSWLYREKSRVFAAGGGRARRWTGQVKTPPRCGANFARGHAEGEEFLLTGTIRFGEAWLGCAPRYADFLKVYRTAQARGTNPCHMDMD
ncbi:meteorin-like protein [Anguilla rostrata]|uniref:meteorin-like protein n=1 Tax=Anguilla rostrata TaxID=7938 RepID=UPI0030CFB05C